MTAAKDARQTLGDRLPKPTALNFACKSGEGIDANTHEQGIADRILAIAACNEGAETSSEGRERTLGKQRTDARGRRTSGRRCACSRKEESAKTAEERSKELDHMANL